MTNDKPDQATQDLVDDAAETRERVVQDVERLASQLTPAHLKDRALDLGERSIESLAARGLLRLAQAPRKLVAYVRKHPVAGATIGVGAALVVWRIALARQR